MSIINSIRSQIAPIPPQGYPFIGGFALTSLVLFWIWTPLGWLGTVATLWCAYFFRDPARVTPLREGLVVAPADGRVSRVANALPPPELGLGDRPLPRISIFMSVFDCHVNRSPVSGRIERMVYAEKNRGDKQRCHQESISRATLPAPRKHLFKYHKQENDISKSPNLFQTCQCIII